MLTALGRDLLLRRLLHPRRVDMLYRLTGVVLVLAGLVQAYVFLFQFDGLELLFG